MLKSSERVWTGPRTSLRQSESFLQPISQTFSATKRGLIREVSAGRFTGQSLVPPSGIDLDRSSIDPAREWALAQLRGTAIHNLTQSNETLRIVDVFSGCGGLTAGVTAAASAVGLQTELIACVDIDATGLDVLDHNFQPLHIFKRNADSLVDYHTRTVQGRTGFAYVPELLEPVLKDYIGKVQIVMGGPPCQGHSNFNNHSRRDDPKNALYLVLPALGIALDSEVILVENVPSVLNDKKKVVGKAISLLETSGYNVDTTILQAARCGTAQDRKRHFLIAVKSRPIDLSSLLSALAFPRLSVWDAISDLEDIRRDQDFDVPSELSPENKRRIDWLFDNDAYNLPNEIRPDCHKEGHTYPSVYGRLSQNQPAQTITGGFMTPGRGRFVHPTQRRGLTPHEGARLQGFPDSFRFHRASGAALYRKDYAKLIGDAVPPPLSYVIGLACMSHL